MGYVFVDNDKVPSVEGKSLFDFADTLKVRVPTSCGRTGECHECIVQIIQGHQALNNKTAVENFLGPNFRLSCQAKIEDANQNVQFDVLRRQPKILSKGIKRDHDFSPSTYIKDYKVISDSFKRDEILNIKLTPIYGIAVDLGTTTVVCSLVNLENGDLVGSASFENPQRFGGSDTLHRISYDTGEFPGELQAVIIAGLNFEIGELCKKHKVRRRHIYEMIVVGNTTMRDIFFGINVYSVGQKPYKSLTQLDLENGDKDSTSLVEKAKRLNIRIHPDANIHSPPLIGCHIGSDVTADLVAIGLDILDDNFILLDVGTNTEIVLGNLGNLVAASCPAGPAFEGGDVTYAMPGYDGAIEHFRIQDGVQEFSTINDQSPQGICGSGLIDLIASLRKNSIMNEFGVFSNGEDNFHLENANGINVSRSDLSALAQAKAANYCGQSIALRNSGIDLRDFSNLFLSGGFANYIDIDNAKSIGFLVDIPNVKIKKVGNAALEGAIMLLKNKKLRTKFELLVKSIRHLELETDEHFFEHFVEGCQFKKLALM